MNHSFNVEFAVKYGLNEAILFENILFWCLHNKANDKSFYDGCYWTYNSINAFKELFPYLTLYGIKNSLKKLEEEKLIKTGNYNKSNYDRTMWYAITELGYSIYRNQQMENEKPTNQFEEIDQPIPYINTDSKPDIKTNNKEDDPFVAFAGDDQELLSLLNDFETMRKQLKKPMTPRAKEILIDKLQKEFPARDLQIATISQSIMNSWQGIFPIKKQPQQQERDAIVTDYSYGELGVDHF